MKPTMHVRLLLKTRATRGTCAFLLRPWFGGFEPSCEGMTTNGPNNKTKTRTSGNVHTFSIDFDDASLLECFLNHPPIEQIRFPLDYIWIWQHRFEDELLQQMYQLKPME